VSKNKIINECNKIDSNKDLAFESCASESLGTIALSASLAPSTISIFNNNEVAIEINLETGNIEFGKNYNPNKDAKLFWDNVLRYVYTNYVQLKNENNDLKEQLSAVKEHNKGFARTNNNVENYNRAMKLVK